MNQIITTLIFAWFLSLFGIHECFVQAMYELFKRKVTINTYYFMALVVGFVWAIYELAL